MADEANVTTKADSTEQVAPDPVAQAREAAATAAATYAPASQRDVPRSSILDQYMADVERHYGGARTEADPSQPSVPADKPWDGEGTAPGAADDAKTDAGTGTKPSDQEQTDAVAPDSKADLDYEQLTRDPKLAPRLQSEIDRRANALYQARLRKTETDAEQARREQRAKDEAAQLEHLTELAMEDDPFIQDGYNDEAAVRKHNEIVQAKAQLRERKEVQRLRVQWEQEELPNLYNWVKDNEVGQIVQGLATQYEEGYTTIPELQDPNLAASVRHENFAHAGQWLQTLVDQVSTVRVRQALEAERERLAKDNDQEVDVRANVRTTQALAEFRAKLPNVDLTPEAHGDGSTGAFTNQLQVRAAHSAGRLKHMSSAQIRALLDSLPEGDLWGEA